VQRHAPLDCTHVMHKELTSRAAVGVLVGQVDEVLLAEAAVGLRPGGQGLGR
jgi:hypothetical protein